MVWSGLCSYLWCTGNLSPVMQERSRNPCQQSGLAGRRRWGFCPMFKGKSATLHGSKGLNYSLYTGRGLLWFQDSVRARAPKTKPVFQSSRGWLVMEMFFYLAVQWLAALLFACPTGISSFSCYQTCQSLWNSSMKKILCGAQQQRANWHWRPFS